MKLKTKLIINIPAALVVTMFIVGVPLMVVINNFTSQSDSIYLALFIVLSVSFVTILILYSSPTLEITDTELTIKNYLTRRKTVIKFADYKESGLTFKRYGLGEIAFYVNNKEIIINSKYYNKTKFREFFSTIESNLPLKERI